jgi:hypothetical protein
MRGLCAPDRHVLARELDGAQDREERVLALLELRTLMGAIRVLDGKVVQAELPLHRPEHIVAGS